jgi:hypothetical protein
MTEVSLLMPVEHKASAARRHAELANPALTVRSRLPSSVTAEVESILRRAALRILGEGGGEEAGA